MANDLLITAIRDRRLDRAKIAEITGVDSKTVDRWIAGRVPHPRYRAVIARELGVPEAVLWPDTARGRGRAGLAEITGAWARRDAPDAPDWRALLRGAKQHVDLIGYSLLSILDTRGAIDALAEKATDGVSVRIAVADPTCEHVLAAEIAARQPGRLTTRITAAHDKLAQLAVQSSVQIRQHAVATSHTILRFDDELLLTVHLHGTPGFQAPLLHIRRQHDYSIFDQLARHIEDVWAVGKPLPTSATQASGPAGAGPAPPQRSGADELLDRLENTWRPS